MACELCHDDGRMELSRAEPDGRTTWWAVPCRCAAGRRWDNRLDRRIPAAGGAGTWDGGGPASPAGPDPPARRAELAERLGLLRESLGAGLRSAGEGVDETTPPNSG